MRGWAWVWGGVPALVVVAVTLAWFWARPSTPDEFYRSVAPDGAPGTLLAVEPYALDVPDTADGWRILYSTTRIDGAPALASAVVMVPKAANGVLLPIAWAHGTNGIAPGCAPSVVGPFNNVPAVAELLAEGWAYIGADYVGLGTNGGHAYLVGEDAARAVLDAVRAASRMNEADIGTRTVVWGHSQGGHSALWTGMLAADYAPDLDVLGIATQAPASDLPGLIEAVEATMFGKIVSSFLLFAYAQAYEDVHVEDYVDAYRAAILGDISGRCAVDARALVSMAQLLTMPGALFGAPPDGTPLGERLVQNVPRGPFAMPVFIGQGDDDPIVLERVQTGYAAGLCADGQTVDYRVYAGRDHLSLLRADSPLVADLVAWTRARFAVEPASGNCAAQREGSPQLNAP